MFVSWQIKPRTARGFGRALLTLEVYNGNQVRLNMGGRPIANKHCEGKMPRPLKRRVLILEVDDGNQVADTGIRVQLGEAGDNRPNQVI